MTWPMNLAAERGTTLPLVAMLLFCLAIVMLYATRAQTGALKLGASDAQARALLAAAQTGLETALAQADTLLQAAPPFDASGWTSIDGPSAQLHDGITYRSVISNHGFTPSSLTLIEVEARAEDGSGGAREVRQQAWLSDAGVYARIAGSWSDF
jgi:hypothetical protein